MNIWAKMITALRGGATEAGEAIVDNQALRILDQEVRDAYEELKQSKDSLAEIMARQKLAEDKCTTMRAQIVENENYVIKALDKGDESLAQEVAEKIAGLEDQFDQEKSASDNFTVSVSEFRTAIMQTERNLKRLKQQVDTVKATENVQRAQEAVAQRHSGSHSKMRTAMDSLERIKEKQALKSAQMASAGELAEEAADTSLKNRLEDAGITSGGHSASEVLERLKNSKSSQSS